MTLPEMDLVDQATMQSYPWERQYTGVVLRWCTGYLDDQELVAFLKKASSSLKPSRARTTRYQGPGSFVLVFDNVLQEG